MSLKLLSVKKRQNATSNKIFFICGVKLGLKLITVAEEKCEGFVENLFVFVLNYREIIPNNKCVVRV